MARSSNLSRMMGERMSRIVDAASDYERTPIGTRQRSPEELQYLWESIMALGPDEQRDVLRTIAKAAGHKDDESKPCEMCRFVAGRMVP